MLRRYFTTRKTMTRWLICDMDNTLLDKKPGMYPRFRDSPCFDSLNRWIELGGKLLVVTSDDGKRPTEQFYKEIPLSNRRNVLMSTAGGACLYRNAEKSDFEFWKQGGGGIPNPDSIHVLAVNLARSYLLDSYAQNSLLDHLQTSRREKILQFLNRFSSLESLSQKLECDEAFLSHGSLVPGLSFVWTNRCDYGVTNMFVLGMPISISNRYVTPSIREALNRLGSDCSLAPNSVCIKSRGVDKDTPLRWLHDSTKDFEFSISNQSVAIGDNPNGNDRALTSLFDEYNLSFVNVGERPFVENGCYQLGGFEHGTASLIDSLVDIWKRTGDLPAFDHAFLSSLISDIRR